MYKVILKADTTFNVEINLQQNTITGKINEHPYTAEIQQLHPYEYLIKYNSHSYSILILRVNKDEKTLTLKINGKRRTVQVKDHFDLLLEQLGMDNMKNTYHDVIKAPMPGLVLSVLVSDGQQVKKGDTLLILEAMKMENMIKAPTDGIIKKIHVQPKTTVEKNQILIEL